jgi:MSHA biogenesis protein MshI
VGLALDRGGFSLAHVTREREQGPRLELALDQRLSDTLALRGALAASVNENDLGGLACNVVLTPELYCLRQVDPPAVEPDEVREAARWSIRDLVDFPVEDAVIDTFPSPEVRGRPTRLNVVAARRKSLQQLVETVTRSGLALRAIDLTEFALRNTAQLLPSDAHGVAILHPLPQVSVLTLTCQGCLWFSRQLDADPESLETAAQEALDGKLDPVGEGAQRLDALLLELQRSLDYYERQLARPAPEELVLTPSHPDLSCLRTWLEDRLPLPVRALELRSLLHCSDGVTSDGAGPSFRALGAALRSAGEAA